MSTTQCVLLYGHDSRLLLTRQLILEHSCLEVHIVEDLGGVDQVTLQQRVDLLILCHSLSYEECAAALAIASVRCPAMRHIVLTASDSSCAATPKDIVVDTNDGPTSLVAAVEQLLYSSSSPVLLT